MNDGAWAAIGALFLISLGQLVSDIAFRWRDDNGREAERERLGKTITKLKRRIRRLEEKADIPEEEDSDVSLPFRGVG